MSLFDNVHDWLTDAYDSANDAYEDIRPFVPGTVWTDLGPIPIKSSIDLLFGDDWQRASTLEAYAVLFGGARQTTSSDADAITRSVQPFLGDPAVTQLIIPNCFQVTIQATAGGHVVENVVGVQNAGGTAAGAGAAVQAAWKVASGPMTQLLNLYTLTGFRTVDIGSANGAINQITDTTAGGVATGAFATRGACCLIKWNGGTRSKSSRGRLYFGPLRETQINTDGATMDSTSLASINTVFANFRASLTSAGYPLVVLSRVLSIATVVTSSAGETTIATQRRRIRN